MIEKFELELSMSENLQTFLEDLDQFGDLVISTSTVFQNKHNLVNVKAFEKEGKFAVELELSNKADADLIGAIETALKDAGFTRAYSSSSNNGPLTVFFDKKGGAE